MLHDAAQLHHPANGVAETVQQQIPDWKNGMAIDYERASELLLEKQKGMTCDQSTKLEECVVKLFDTLEGAVPFDWRYNATHWALDVGNICGEIGYSIAWMRAFAAYSMECAEQDRRSAEGRVSYYADNAATRITSCRDKLALLAWSYYCPFNPDKKSEVLNFEQVRERFTCPIRFGLQLDGHQEFLTELNKLLGSPFELAAAYRHKKVHRMEPRVLMRAPQAPDEPSYMFPAVTRKEVQDFGDKLARMYPEERMRSTIRENCLIDGELFDRRAPEQLLWHLKEFDEFTSACWKALCDATSRSCEILLSREPLLSKT